MLWKLHDLATSASNLSSEEDKNIQRQKKKSKSKSPTNSSYEFNTTNKMDMIDRKTTCPVCLKTVSLEDHNLEINKTTRIVHEDAAWTHTRAHSKHSHLWTNKDTEKTKCTNLFIAWVFVSLGATAELKQHSWAWPSSRCFQYMKVARTFIKSRQNSQSFPPPRVCTRGVMCLFCPHGGGARNTQAVRFALKAPHAIGKRVNKMIVIIKKRVFV